MSGVRAAPTFAAAVSTASLTIFAGFFAMLPDLLSDVNHQISGVPSPEAHKRSHQRKGDRVGLK
jgi:hypothetical protein